jgi:hypothetical protein
MPQSHFKHDLHPNPVDITEHIIECTFSAKSDAIQCSAALAPPKGNDLQAKILEKISLPKKEVYR